MGFLSMVDYCFHRFFTEPGYMMLIVVVIALGMTIQAEIQNLRNRRL